MTSVQGLVHTVDAQAFEELHQGMVVELSRWSGNRSPTSNPDVALDDGIVRSISAIEAAGTAIELLTEKCRGYEEDLRNYSKAVGELKFSLEGAHQKLARATIDAQSAGGKAARMEAETNELRGQIKNMVAREAGLTANLDRMIKAVNKNFAFTANLEDRPFKRAVGE
jgi:chromosome segregation ATPase